MSDDFQRNVHCLLGLPFDAVDMGSTVSQVWDAAMHRRSLFFSTPNLNWLVSSLSDNALRDSVIESDLSIADGLPLVWVAKLLRVPIHQRVSGSGVFENLRTGNRGQISVYFFGGAESIAKAACSRLNSKLSALTCVGYECPGFGSVEDMSSEETIARINASGAAFVVVSLGASKGQAWIRRNRARLFAPVISHLGAVVNFVAGTVHRAPLLVQRLGLEWVWRIKEEPVLWRRYFSDGLVFLWLLVARVAPHCWFNFRHKPSSEEVKGARIDLLDQGDEVIVRLRGAWVLRNITPLQECFSRLASSRSDVRLEMEHVAYVDSAFIGLLMLLYANRKRRGKRLSVSSLTESVRRVVHYACADFLLESQ